MSTTISFSHKSLRWCCLAPAMVLTSVLLSSCVSSTLESSKPVPIAPTSELALSEENRQQQLLRSVAITQIRAKADAVPENAEAPAYGVPRQGETVLLTPGEVAAKTVKMNATSAQVQAQIPDAELREKQRKMNELRRKGISHYKSALFKIEKK